MWIAQTKRVPGGEVALYACLPHCYHKLGSFPGSFEKYFLTLLPFSLLPFLSGTSHPPLEISSRHLEKGTIEG